MRHIIQQCGNLITDENIDFPAPYTRQGRGGLRELVVGSRWSVVGTRLAPNSHGAITVIVLVIGSRWSVVGARLAFESALYARRYR